MAVRLAGLVVQFAGLVVLPAVEAAQLAAKAALFAVREVVLPGAHGSGHAGGRDDASPQNKCRVTALKS